MRNIEWIDVAYQTPATYTFMVTNSKTGEKKAKLKDMKYDLVPIKFANGITQLGWYNGATWDFGIRKTQSRVVAWKPTKIEE